MTTKCTDSHCSCFEGKNLKLTDQQVKDITIVYGRTPKKLHCCYCGEENKEVKND